MKNSDTNKLGMILPFALAAIFIAVGVSAPFFPGEQLDTEARYIIMAALVTMGLVIGIGSAVSLIRVKRENKALNEFVKQCGENAVAIPAIYIKTNDRLIYESAAKALTTGDTTIGLAKLLKVETTIHFAVMCDDGIYFIPFKGISTPQNNTFYKRDNLPQHTVTVNAKEQIILTCPEIQMLAVFAVTKTSEVDRNQLLDRLNNLYGNTLQIDTTF